MKRRENGHESRGKSFIESIFIKASNYPAKTRAKTIGIITTKTEASFQFQCFINFLWNTFLKNSFGIFK